ncbi:hypothetical protein ACFQZS_01310 [Mucilaginibacter calamicampi]|uniref:Uncharacterized protein n=1 Tax=Mucilaginibacter calamicampi TaxID=1302352 RepID=A0ABW2YRC6_9SPHI
MAAEAFFLFLDKKKQKSSQQRGFFAAHGLCPANQVKPRAVKFCPAVAPTWPTLQQKITMPLPTHGPSVFPAFIRSLSADEFRFNNNLVQTIARSFLRAWLAPLWPRKPLFFFLDKKEPKNQVSREASLPHRAFALQIRKNHGL